MDNRSYPDAPNTVKALVGLMCCGWILLQLNEWLMGRFLFQSLFSVLPLCLFVGGLLKLQRVFWWWALGGLIFWLIFMAGRASTFSSQSGQSQRIFVNGYVFPLFILFALSELTLLLSPATRQAFGIGFQKSSNGA